MWSTHPARLERVRHRLARGPASAALVVIQASDVHAGGRGVRRAFAQAVARLPAEADLVVITGDCLSRRDPDDAAFVAGTLAARVRARRGCFAVLGNHDYDVYGPPGLENRADLELAGRVIAALESCGFQVLRNEWTLCGADLVVAGADDVGAKQIDPIRTLQGAPESALRLLLVHNPDGALAVLARHPADLVLAGHTHGGQLRLPGLPPPFVP
jgi:predicted MPP superfamily phosphohydrolase